MNKKQDWRTADKANRDTLKNDSNRDESRREDSQRANAEKNLGAKKPLHDMPQTESAPGTRAGQRSTESRNSGGNSRR